MLRGFSNDSLKVLRLNVAVAILVEEQKSLPDSLALKTTEHLRKFMIRKVVASGLVANVKLCPLAVPVKGNAVRAFVHLVEAAEVVICNRACSVDIEKSESDLILGIGFEKQVVESSPVGDTDAARALAIGDMEEKAILFTLDLALRKKVALVHDRWSLLMSPSNTYVILIGWCDCINELLLSHVQLAGLSILAGNGDERRLVLG